MRDWELNIWIFLAVAILTAATNDWPLFRRTASRTRAETELARILVHEPWLEF
jgi:hypothetical protein